ncbi:putative acetyl-coenzyme A synthetase [Bradyrhizobium diazoefficiens]|uniref:Putative acetyl-coenzyme A synthetase n=1 Tax=Bradyrhizobium diazoefficiens TaxID=1355477 RepID=A0A0E4G0U0_9BRAD|nr:putative acetyl-coenzyme A synthetase [Bradyrhizobium diazoefficiens]
MRFAPSGLRSQVNWTGPDHDDISGSARVSSTTPHGLRGSGQRLPLARSGPFNWALDWFDAELAANAESKDRPALWIVDAAQDRQTKLSFAALSRRSNQVANFLRAQGLKRGDHLLLLLGNVVPLWETMLAAMKLGVVVIPATTLLTADELRDRLDRGKAKAVVAAQDQVAKFASLGAENVVRIVVGAASDGWLAYDEAAEAPDSFVPDGPTHADDPMLLYFTSGTTAKPKLVLHSQRSYPVGHLSTMYWIGLKPGDVHLNISSPGWAKHAWSCFFAPWNAGATVFVVNQPRFDAKALLATIGRCGVTTLCAPPTVWRLFIQENLASFKVALREVCGAGEPLNPEVIDQVQAAWGLTIRDGYGQTETTALAGNSPGQNIKVGSMGRPLPGYRVQVSDADGNPAKEGEVTLVLGANRPAGLMQGYQGDDGKLSGAEGALYRSGDVVFEDEDGYLTFVGRSDDVFKSSDYRISPFELESVLLEHELVAEAAVVPSPDPIRLAIPKAFVLLTSGAERTPETALSIFKHLHTRLAPFKRIRRLEIVTELPKTISGKIRRLQLRRLERDDDRGDPLRGREFREEDFPELPKTRSES